MAKEVRAILKLISLLLTILVLFSGTVLAETELSADNLLMGPIRSFEVLTNPLGWGTSEWARASVVAGTTIVLFFYDKELQEFVLDHRSPATEFVAAMVEPLGNGFVVLTGLGGAYLYSLKTGQEKLGQVVEKAWNSFAVSGLVVGVLKFSTHRHRPVGGQDRPHIWDGPSFYPYNLSFPSGHSITAFSVATVLAKSYEDEYPVLSRIPYVLAGLTALSRIHDEKHWPSDVFFGSMLGYAIGSGVMGLDGEDGKIALRPDLRQGLGVSLNWTF